MNMTLNMNNGCSVFFQIKDRNTRANFCKKYFYSETIKNKNGAVALRECFVRRKWKQKLHQLKKGRLKGIEDLINC